MIDIDETEKQVKLLQSKGFIRMQLDLPEVLELIERVRQCEERIAEAAKLHRPTLPGFGPKSCVHDGRAWPCPTAAALGLNEGSET